jgi:hypothetical protein
VNGQSGPQDLRKARAALTNAWMLKPGAASSNTRRACFPCSKWTIAIVSRPLGGRDVILRPAESWRAALSCATVIVIDARLAPNELDCPPPFKGRFDFPLALAILVTRAGWGPVE